MQNMHSLFWFFCVKFAKEHAIVRGCVSSAKHTRATCNFDVGRYSVCAADCRQRASYTLYPCSYSHAPTPPSNRYLYGNNLKGSIPSALASLTKLTVM